MDIWSLSSTELLIYTAIITLPMVVVAFVIKRPSKSSFLMALLALAGLYTVVMDFRFVQVEWMYNPAIPTEKNMQVAAELFEEYKEKRGRYPLASEGWSALADQFYVEGERQSDSIIGIRDMWGNVIIYVGNDGSSFELYSKGKDGLSHSNGNDPDDINTWDQSMGSYP